MAAERPSPFFLAKKDQKAKNTKTLQPTGKTPWPAFLFSPALAGFHASANCKRIV
jgi:hypothetical protein